MLSLTRIQLVRAALKQAQNKWQQRCDTDEALGSEPETLWGVKIEIAPWRGGWLKFKRSSLKAQRSSSRWWAASACAAATAVGGYQ